LDFYFGNKFFRAVVSESQVCSYSLQQCDATPLTSLQETVANSTPQYLPAGFWGDEGKGKRKEKRKGKGKGGGGKGKAGEERRRGQKEGGGRKRERKEVKERGKEGTLCSFDFPYENPWVQPEMVVGRLQ